MSNYHGQWLQDQFIEENIFKGYKNGIFMDVGAHDGISLNNTLYFEKQNNWSGINIEPIKSVYDLLVKNRPNCININCAVSNNDGVEKFICNTGYTEMLSGLYKSYDYRHKNRLLSENIDFKSTTEYIDVITRKISTICNDYDIKHIHLLSIDVEGSEFDVIKSIDFDKLFVDLIVFENNYQDISDPIIIYLNTKNYKLVKYSHDIYMLHNNSIFNK